MLVAGNYDLVLVIDQREAVLQRGALLTLQTSLAAHMIPYSMRTLPIGDFLWICREKQSDTADAEDRREPEELVLSFLVERKREDDLYSSIIDGRYAEQKARIHRSGMETVVYVIEHFAVSSWKSSSAGNTSSATTTRTLSQRTLLSAISSTMINDDFIIHRTSTFEETVLFLISMTKWIQHFIDGKAICVSEEMAGLDDEDVKQRVQAHSSFKSFSRSHGRRSGLTLGEICISQLCCIHSISADKARAIAELYPTIHEYLLLCYPSLWTAFENAQEDPELLLANIILPNGRRLGEKSSKLIYNIIFES